MRGGTDRRGLLDPGGEGQHTTAWAQTNFIVAIQMLWTIIVASSRVRCARNKGIIVAKTTLCWLLQSLICRTKLEVGRALPDIAGVLNIAPEARAPCLG